MATLAPRLLLFLCPFAAASGCSNNGPDTDSASPGITVGSGARSDTSECYFYYWFWSVTADWSDDGFDPPMGCGDELTVSVNDPDCRRGWRMGLVDTGNEEPWTGEDCISAGSICHEVGLARVLDQTADCTRGSAASGTTSFDASMEEALTYYIEDTEGFCFAWGEQPSYYLALGCSGIIGPY